MKKLIGVVVFLFFIHNIYSQNYPAAEKIPYQTFIHNDTLTDNYFWLRDKYSAEVINYLYANNAHANAAMKPTALLQKVIYDEMLGRIVEAKDTKPRKIKNYYYFNRTLKDAEYPIILRKKDSLNAPEQVVLDLNKLAKEFNYFSLNVSSLSPDQTMFAYGVDNKGNNVGKLFVKHIDADSILQIDTIPQMLSFIWCRNSHAFYYTVPEPKTKRSFKVYRHRLGQSYQNDELILEEKDVTFQIGMGLTASEQFITFNISKTKSNEIWYIDAKDTINQPTLFLKRTAGVQYGLAHFSGNEVFISTDKEAINYKLVKTTFDKPEPQHWINVIPARKHIMLTDYELLKNYLIWQEQENAQPRVLVKNLTTKSIDTIAVNLPIYNISFGIENFNYDSSENIQYTVTNDIEPATTYQYNLLAKESKITERDSLNEPYNSSQYETKRIYATAADGVKIPITISHKKGIILNGNNPTLLTGYGSYGGSTLPGFSSSELSFLNRGFVLATAHIRGSNDLGMQWYEAGKMLNKKNTFTDFIACAEQLITDKYTNQNKLAIEGGSAGGLLVGAVVNLRPDLFKCVVANVPFVDVINTMLDETIPLTTFEYEEWGNPKNKTYYQYMKSYSPYDNVEAKNYPSMLVTAGYNDAQVGYWEPAKWVAKLRELKTDTNQILLKTNMDGGHGGASGRYEALKERAFTLAYIMGKLGVKENYITLKGKVVDANNNPIEYANIYIEGQGIGTNSNADGDFTLRLKEINNITIVTQSIGFEKKKTTIDLNTRTKDLVIKMRSDNVLLKTALVTADGKDPALGIIKNAIKNRKTNYNKVNNFSADVYMKSNIRLDEIPKNLPAILKVVANGETIDSNDLGLVYLSESVAKYHFEKPDLVKEKMIASRVAGQKQGFSFNRVEDVFINFYEPNVKLSYYSERPFISPIAPLANLSYQYKYRGTLLADGKDIYKIEVIPLRKGDPLFHGHIYIASGDYQLYGIDMFITKDAQIEFVDTLFLAQEMTNVNNIYMPLQLKLYSHVKVFGFKATDLSLATMSSYEVNKTFGNKFFNYEVFSIEKNANKKDTSYWGNTRTIVLTEEENKHYQKSDSILKAHSTPQYLDSMNRRMNKFNFSDLLISGYSYTKKNDSITKTFSFDPIPFAIGFNTVEGVYINYQMNYSIYHTETRQYTSINPILRYGVANKNFTAGLNFIKSINPYTRTYFSLAAGRFITQYNGNEPINPFINSLYTLAAGQNYAKYLQKDVLGIRFNHELVNGLYGSIGLSYMQRQAMVNHSNYSFVKTEDKHFTSNNPTNPSNDAPAFITHQAFSYQVNLRYVPFQRYESLVEYKRVLDNKYPDLYASFKQTIGTSGQKFNAQIVEIGTGKDIELNQLGVFSFDASGGLFLVSNSLLFTDYKHFNGNQTIFLTSPTNNSVVGSQTRERLTSFHALNYYNQSTNQSYLEIHALQNFRSFFIGKIPLLRVCRGYELVGINFLQTPNVTYTEGFVGLTNLFNILRIDAGKVISSSANNNWFFRVGLSGSF